MRGYRSDRDTAADATFARIPPITVSGRRAVPAARSAAKQERNQPRATTVYHRSAWLVLIPILIAAFAAAAHAQVNTASVTGQVRDESKAMLPGVTVTATEVATGR